MGANLGKLQYQLSVDTTSGTASIKKFKGEVAGVDPAAAKAQKGIGGLEAKTLLMGAAFAFALKGLHLLLSGLGASIDAASTMEASFISLISVAEKYGITQDEVTKAAKDLSADGLIPIADSSAALKNLLIKGFGLPEAIILLQSFKDASAFGRQSMLSMGEAVRSAAEGVKNDNSVLVDNAGITTNLSVMIKNYAKQIGKSTTALSDAEKRQAILNGVMEEGAVFAGNAAKLTTTYAGATQKLSSQFFGLKAQIGTFITQSDTAAASVEFMSLFIKELTKDLREIKAWIDTAGVSLSFRIDDVSKALKNIKIGWLDILEFVIRPAAVIAKKLSPAMTALTADIDVMLVEADKAPPIIEEVAADLDDKLSPALTKVKKKANEALDVLRELGETLGRREKGLLAIMGDLGTGPSGANVPPRNIKDGPGPSQVKGFDIGKEVFAEGPAAEAGATFGEKFLDSAKGGVGGLVNMALQAFAASTGIIGQIIVGAIMLLKDPQALPAILQEILLAVLGSPETISFWLHFIISTFMPALIRGLPELAIALFTLAVTLIPIFVPLIVSETVRALVDAIKQFFDASFWDEMIGRAEQSFKDVFDKKIAGYWSTVFDNMQDDILNMASKAGRDFAFVAGKGIAEWGATMGDEFVKQVNENIKIDIGGKSGSTIGDEFLNETSKALGL